jgi:hypothetical protein
MNRMWMLLVVAAFPLIAIAQTDPSSSSKSSGNTPPPYQPAVPAPSTSNQYGGWSGYSGGTTVAGSALNGMASVISAKGDYNLSTSAAAINMTQAQKNEIENRQQWTNTYFQMREENRRARAAERGPRMTMEQVVRIAKEGAPRPLAPSQMDHVNGQLNWPSALQQESFASQRKEVDQLFALRARYGGLGYADQMKVRETVDAMFDGLKTQIDQIPPQDYTTCRSFLRSLSYAATKTELE